MNSKHIPTLKVALITGITGQDGSYLAEFLLEEGCKVHGIKRRAKPSQALMTISDHGDDVAASKE